jgi:hypothetical protein
MNNEAFQKAMALHCKTMAKAHEAAADCHQSLSECFKAEQAEGLHKGMKDMHADLQSCHKSMSESYGKLGDACKKSAGTDDDLEKMTAAVATAVIDKIGNMVQPTDVRKVFQTPDPNAVNGLTLVGRPGQATPPTSMESIPPELRSMVQE